MKKRNKHFWKEKQLIRLRLEDQKNSDAQRNQGLVKLEEPIHHGYNAEWVLRKDISQREDAHVYQEALDACKGSIWSKNKDFRYKSRKTKTWHIAKPKLKHINKAEYEKLSPSAKKFFHEDISYKKNYFHRDTFYICTLSFELVTKISKSFITHRRIIDNILLQEEAEIEKAMYNISPNPWGYRRGSERDWQRHEDKKVKLAEERKIVEVKKSYTAKGDWKDKNDLLDIN